MIVYAKTKEGVVTPISKAEKKIDYFIDGHTYISRKGEVNRHHFALKNSKGGYNGHFTSNESREHYNTKIHLEYIKEIEIDGIKIKACSSDSEVGLNGRIIDVVYYDSNGGVLCLIEVVKTSDLEDFKIKDLKNYNIIRYDINKGSERIEFIPREFRTKEIRERIRSGKEFVSKKNGEFTEAQISHQESEYENRSIELKASDRERNNTNREIEIAELENRINTFERKTFLKKEKQRIRENCQHFFSKKVEKIQEKNRDFEFEIQNIERLESVSKIKGRIKIVENEIKQLKKDMHI